MSAMSSFSIVPIAVEERLGGVGVVGVDVDAERGLVAHDQDRVAERLEQRLEAAAVELPPITAKLVQ